MHSIKKLINFIFDRYVVINKVAFFINETYIFDHYSNIIRKISSHKFDLILGDKLKKEKYKNFVNQLKKDCNNIFFLKDILYFRKYKILLTHLHFNGNTIHSGTVFSRINFIVFKAINFFLRKRKKKKSEQYLQNKLGIYNIKFSYGVDDGSPDYYGKYNYLFNEFFCHGPRDSQNILKKFNKKVYQMGYPRYENYFNNSKNKNLKFQLKKKYKCIKKKKTILWICTKSQYFSTILTYQNIMQKLTDKFNVILRPHPREINSDTEDYNQKVHDIINSGKFISSDISTQNMSELYLIADYVFCDYGGSIFSALYCKKKILLMNNKKANLDKVIVSSKYQSSSIIIRKYFPSINEKNQERIMIIIKKVLSSSKARRKMQKARELFFGKHKKIETKSSYFIKKKLEKMLKV
jgi:hypothetical protein